MSSTSRSTAYGAAVAAIAAAPAVVVEHDEVRREKCSYARVRGSISRLAADQDDRRSFTQPIERDDGAGRSKLPCSRYLLPIFHAVAWHHVEPASARLKRQRVWLNVPLPNLKAVVGASSYTRTSTLLPSL